MNKYNFDLDFKQNIENVFEQKLQSRDYLVIVSKNSIFMQLLENMRVVQHYSFEQSIINYSSQPDAIVLFLNQSAFQVKFDITTKTFITSKTTHQASFQSNINKNNEKLINVKYNKSNNIYQIVQNEQNNQNFYKFNIESKRMIDSQLIKQIDNTQLKIPQFQVSDEEEQMIIAFDYKLVVISQNNYNSSGIKKELKLNQSITSIDVFPTLIDNKLQVAFSLSKVFKIQILYIESAHKNKKIQIKEFQTQHWHSSAVSNLKFNHADSLDRLILFSGGCEHTLVARSLHRMENMFLSRLGQIEKIQTGGHFIIVKNTFNRIILASVIGDNLQIHQQLTFPKLHQHQTTLKINQDYIMCLGHPTQIDLISIKNFQLVHQFNRNQSQNVMPKENELIQTINDFNLFENEALVTLECHNIDVFKTNIMNIQKLDRTSSYTSHSDVVYSIKYPLEQDLMADTLLNIVDTHKICVYAIQGFNGFSVYKLTKSDTDEVFVFNINKISKQVNSQLHMSNLTRLAHNMLISCSHDLDHTKSISLINVHSLKDEVKLIHQIEDRITNFKSIKENLYLFSNNHNQIINLNNLELNKLSINGIMIKSNLNDYIYISTQLTQLKDQNEYQISKFENIENSNIITTINSKPELIQANKDNLVIQTSENELQSGKVFECQKDLDNDYTRFEIELKETELNTKAKRVDNKMDKDLLVFVNNEHQIELEVQDIFNKQFAITDSKQKR